MNHKFNNGEWSEIYGILYLLMNPNINIVDSKLNVVNDNQFQLQEVFLNKEAINYQRNLRFTEIFINGNFFTRVNSEDIKLCANIILRSIKSLEKKGAFEIKEVNDFLHNISGGYVLKSPSYEKSDLKLKLLDKRYSNEVNLSYSIKSSFKNASTLLNSSAHTNIEFKVKNLKREDVMIINSIKTKAKLLDRISKIRELGGVIEYSRICSESFKFNLEMIDSNLPLYLANTVLYSYTDNVKNLKEAFLKSNEFIDTTLALKKLSDLLEGASFGFFPSEKWNGLKNVNGGIILIIDSGKVLILDLVYYRNHVIDYLVNETKLETPSTKRYHMLELEIKEDNEVYFTLNTQIRFKK